MFSEKKLPALSEIMSMPLESAHEKTKENKDSANAYIKKDDDTDGEIGRDGEGKNIVTMIT